MSTLVAGGAQAQTITTVNFGAQPGAVNPVTQYQPNYTPNTLTFSGLGISVTGWHYTPAQAAQPPVYWPYYSPGTPATQASVAQAHVTNFLNDGLGVLAQGENGSITGNGEYQIDNYNGIDFVLLDFGQDVTLKSIDTISFGIATGYYFYSFDQDFSFGTTGGATSSAVLAAINNVLNVNTNSPAPSGNWYVPNNSNAPSVALGTSAVGQYWLIGASTASQQQQGQQFDAFKLTGVSYETSSPVPEPASWALMLGGFGAAGYTLRRKRRALQTA